MICHHTLDDWHHTIHMVVVDLIAELAMWVFTIVSLRRQGIKPLQFLRGVLLGHGLHGFLWYLSFMNVWVIVCVAMQHSHYGTDFSFRFHWIVDDNARWIGSSKWAVERNETRVLWRKNW